MEFKQKTAQIPHHSGHYPTLSALVRSLDGDVDTSLADEVGKEILSRIIRGQVVEGARLKSTVLANELGVSRTPVAKALAKLTADGILVQPNNHQALVAPGASRWLLHNHELRQVLEPVAAFRAAGQMPEDLLTELNELAEATTQFDQEHPDWPRVAQFFDFSLHLAIAQACGNLPMNVSIRKCWTYKKLSYDLSGGCAPKLPREHTHHLEILAAVGSGDADAAQRLMTEHLNRAVHDRLSDRVV